MMYDALIIGGGASGLMACALSGAGKKVLLAEKQARVGRKLLATGNGRCNMTNLNAAPQHYHGARAAAARALELCPPGEVLEYFEALGIPAVADEEGRAYPMSNQAASVLDALRLYADENGCETAHPPHPQKSHRYPPADNDADRPEYPRRTYLCVHGNLPSVPWHECRHRYGHYQ